MAGIGETLWRFYEASPPALLALLTVLLTVGGRYIAQEVRAVQDTQEEMVNRVDQQEIMIDHNADRLDQIREARRRNDERIDRLMQQDSQTGFSGRCSHDDPKADTARRDDPPGDDD